MATSFITKTTLPFLALFKLAVKSWHVIGDGLIIELVASEKGNRTAIIASLPDLEKASALDHTSVSSIFSYCS